MTCIRKLYIHFRKYSDYFYKQGENTECIESQHKSRYTLKKEQVQNITKKVPMVSQDSLGHTRTYPHTVKPQGSRSRRKNPQQEKLCQLLTRPELKNVGVKIQNLTADPRVAHHSQRTATDTSNTNALWNIQCSN